MTLTQRLQILASTQRSRLAELAGLDDITPELRAELDTLGATHQDTESQLRAAIAADDAATPPGDPVFDSEARERLELRAKTGIVDFLRAAAGGAAVGGAAAEYAAACGVPAVGHLPMAIFARTAPAVEERAITPGPAVQGALQPTVPFVFERSAAASLGILMPSVPSGQVQIPKIGTAPPSDTLAKDGAAPATAASVTLVNQGSRPHRRQFRGPCRGSGRHADPGSGAVRVHARLAVERIGREHVQRRGGRAKWAVYASDRCVGGVCRPLPAKIAETLTAPAISVEGGEVSGH